MSDPSLLDQINEYVTASRDVIGLFKDFRSALPKGQSAEDVGRQIEAAERALRASEAQLAKGLGYELCQCTFPPQIMLSQGYHPRHQDMEFFSCPACGKQSPSEEKFNQLDRAKERNERGPRVTRPYMP